MIAPDLPAGPLYLDAIEQRHAGTQNGFCQLANVKHVEVNEPFEVTPGVLVRPARNDEAQTLRELLALFRRPGAPFLAYRNPYETRVENTVISPTHSQSRIHPLPADEHRYYVAEFTGGNVTLHDVLEVSALTECELDMGITIFGAPHFALALGLAQQRILADADTDDDCLITLKFSALEDLRLVFAKFQKHDDEGIGLLPALRQFRELPGIPSSSPLRFLGYVAILESLITHEPAPKDPYDSLTRQVRQKMLLLGRRSQLKIPYERFGVDVKPETIWTKLYAYRSAIAHGVRPDFTSTFQILGSAKQALDFVRDSTAAVMRHALDEPELVSDLRVC